MIDDLFQLFIMFFQIGLFTIGGGYAMIPLIQKEVVGQGFLTLTELTDFIAISESTPGPFAVNIATFVGYQSNGILGAAVATFGVVLPSFLVILIIARFFLSFRQNKYVQYGLKGVRPVVIGLILSAAFSIAQSSLLIGLDSVRSVSDFFLNHLNFLGILIFAVVAFVYFKFKLHPILVILLSAGLGILLFGGRALFWT